MQEVWLVREEESYPLLVKNEEGGTDKADHEGVGCDQIGIGLGLFGFSFSKAVTYEHSTCYLRTEGYHCQYGECVNKDYHGSTIDDS